MRLNRKTKNPNDKHFIYILKCIVTNKVYIGETSDVEMRFDWHMKDGENSTHFKQKYELYQDIFKYGRENFNIQIIEECLFKDAIDREEFWISFYDSYRNGYNNAPRQYVTSLGYQYSEERKLEYKEKFLGENNPFYGKTHSEETKRINSEKRKKWWKQLDPVKRQELVDKMKKRKPRVNGRKIQAFFENNTVKDYPSVMAASRDLDIPHGEIRKLANTDKKIKNILFKYCD